MRRSHLQDDTEAKDEAGYDQGYTTAQPVCDGCGAQGTKERTGRQDGDDFRLLSCGDGQLTFSVPVTRRELVLPVAVDVSFEVVLWS